MRNLEQVIRTSLEEDAARAPELPAEWRPSERVGSQRIRTSAESRARVVALVGVLVLVGISGVAWSTHRSQREGERIETGRSATGGAFPLPGEEFSLQDDGPATALDARVGVPVLQELTRSISVPDHPPLTVFTALTYRAGRGAEEVRCVAQGGSAGCRPEPADPGAHVSVTASVDNGYADFNLWVWSDVPDGVDYVTYADGDERYWQRPVAGVAAFPDVPGDDEEVVGFTEDGVEVARAEDHAPTAEREPDSEARADISKSEFASLVTITQDALSDCLIDVGAQAVTTEILDLPDGVDVRRTWETCVAEANAVLQQQLAAMNVRFFNPATEQPQSDDPAFTYNTILDEQPSMTTSTLGGRDRFDTASKEIEGSPGPRLAAASVARATGVDRITFDFGDNPPAIQVGYGPAADTGDCPDPGVEGPQFLNIRIQSASGYDPYSGEARVTGDAAAATSLMFTCEFEGYLYATISVASATQPPFALYVGDAPGQVVVDLATEG